MLTFLEKVQILRATYGLDSEMQPAAAIRQAAGDLAVDD